MTRQELLETNVSWISCTTSKQVVYFPLKKALASIKSGTQKENILRMRAVVDANHAEYDRIKGTLPANIFSGKFEGGHGAVNNTEYNRLLTLDIDKLDSEQMEKVVSELKEQGDWSIDRIFAQQDEDYLNYQNSAIKKDLIGNVAEVFRGKAVSRKDPAGNIGVVNISNVGDYEIDYSGLDHLQEEERKVSNYLLQEGDVLLPARGTTIRTAIFHEQTYPCIASSNLIVIRPNAKMLDSVYLKVFLDSPIGNKMISGAQQGMTVMNISYKDLKVLEVPIPPIEKQQAVSKEYLDELAKYKEAMNAAQKRWTDVLTRLQKF